MSDAAPVPQGLLAHAAFVRRLARTLLADAHGADDLVQETWRRSLERPPEARGELRGWLARVARNLAFQRRRSDAHRREREQQAARAEELPAADAGLERTEVLQRVVEGVRALEEPYRATILARYYEDLSPGAIAARAGVPVETVNTRLKRGLARLRRTLAPERENLRACLGLLSGGSPCLPAHAGQAVLAGASVKVVLAVAVAAVAALGWSVWRVREPHPAASSAAVAARGAAGDLDPALPPSLRAPAERESVPAAPRPERELSGRVLDEQGAPVVGARVVVLGHHDPFAAHDTHPRTRWNDLRGRIFTTDETGSWRARLPDEVPPELRDCRGCHADAHGELPELARVLVTLAWSTAYERIPADPERWVTAPGRDVDFVVRRMPTGTIEVRVVEGAQRTPLERFKIAVHGGFERNPEGGVTYSRGYLSLPASDALASVEWRVEDPSGVPLHVILLEPEVGSLWSRLFGEGQPLEQEIRLLPGASQDVLFVLPERGLLRGQVVDPSGRPVAGAHVFFGPQARARGDEPFQPFRGERVSDAALTAHDGWFELRGGGAEVTAGHADLSAVTADARAASRIVLGARGAVRGRLLDPAGEVPTGAALRLDDRSHGPRAETDATGRFAFEHVEAGAHAFWLEGEDGGLPLSCVRLEPGEEAEIELRIPAPRGLELVLRPHESVALDAPRGVIVGRERVFDLCEVAPGSAPGTLLVRRSVLPGRYWLVLACGASAPFVVEPGAERVALELGTAELLVRGKLPSVQVVPADADPFLRTMAARVRTRVDAEHGARFRLHPGRYLLVGEAGVVLREIELPAGGLELTLE